MEEMYNTKTAAMNFIQEVCKVRAKGHLADFMHILVGVMNEYKVCDGSLTLSLLWLPAIHLTLPLIRFSKAWVLPPNLLSPHVVEGVLQMVTVLNVDCA